MNLGELIKKERLKKGLNQPELAKIMNVSKQTVSNWENGNRVPDAYTLRKLGDFFNVSVDYFLERNEQKMATLKELEKIQKDITSKSEYLAVTIFKQLIESDVIGPNGEMSEQTRELIFNAIRHDAIMKNKKGATKK